ncbi:MAG: hypothetical protein IKC31_05520 [Clostridia bacterium]|nr:hypothetical protein [Clostridia bacterium]
MLYADAALEKIIEENQLILTVYSQYLNHTPRFLTSELVENLAKECEISNHEAFLALFGAALGLDCAESREHRRLEQIYLRAGISCQDPDVYRGNEYYKTIKFPSVRKGNWEMKHGSYAPYEPFVRTHPVLTKELREIPQIGYFEEEFPFPAILEDGVEWMTVTPNEIETMKEPIQRARGRVLTLGLGLGYFAFCASQKEEVTEVTVIEQDGNVISLVREHLLPQFPHREKIRIVQADAFDFLERTNLSGQFDYLFSDLWHDASDGLEMYIRIKKLLQKHPTLPRDYWIEPSLLSALRNLVYEKLTEQGDALQKLGKPMADFLSDDFLRQLEPELKE